MALSSAPNSLSKYHAVQLAAQPCTSTTGQSSVLNSGYQRNCSSFDPGSGTPEKGDQQALSVLVGPSARHPPPPLSPSAGLTGRHPCIGCAWATSRPDPPSGGGCCCAAAHHAAD
mmetsp:Transcript_111557/g.193590  ORF Transcript_111557/g.193590 Transcript_111557/m.193590 type:complete len:115 (+) Transcript_111557:618-962(+)